MHEFIEVVAEIKTHIATKTNQGYKVVVTDDFNADFNDPNPNAKHLTTEFLAGGMIAADQKTNQVLKYTHFQWRSLSNGDIQRIYKWLDHIFVHHSIKHLLSNILIMNCFTNLGDHLPVTFEFEMHQKECFAPKYRLLHPKLPSLNHENAAEVIKYTKMVEYELSVHHISTVREIEEANNHVEVAATKVFDVTRRVLLNNMETLDTEKRSTNKHGSSTRRKKPWWNAKLSELHANLCKAYVTYRDSLFDPKFRAAHVEARNEFKKYRKHKEREHCDQKLRELNALFSTGINGFWRKIKTMNSIKQLVSVPISEVKRAYEDLFNKRSSTELDEHKVNVELLTPH